MYTYDFGDTWDHTVLFERKLEAEKLKKYPLCLAGKNACPPEDCGSVGGYYELLSVINNTDSKRGEELRDWLGLEDGEKYDPTTFDFKEVTFCDPKEELQEYLENQNSY